MTNYKKKSIDYIWRVLREIVFVPPDTIEAARLQVGEDGPGHVAAGGGLAEEDVDPLQLQVGGALVLAGGGDAVLLGHHWPELTAYSVTALTHLRQSK